jgi:hypothetical protein
MDKRSAIRQNHHIITLADGAALIHPTNLNI